MRNPGDTFGRYTIEATIGQGGMGRVYRAHDARLGRRVALKVLADGAAGAEADERLLREARAAAALDHPNAVAIFDVGEIDGAPYIVMELVPGHTLRRAIEAADIPAEARTVWLTDVARALAAAHRRGLVHRDIKPENVMVRDDGMIKVLDFGIARRSGTGVDPNASTQTSALPTLTVDGARLGTPVYMAPEQIRGEALDGRADQFAWGVLAFELLTGRLPWRGANDAFAVVASILTDDADTAALDQAAVPPPLRDVVLRALAKRPDDRFASMDDVVRALEAAAKGEAAPAVRVAPPARVAPAVRTPEAPGRTAPAPPENTTTGQRFSTQEVRDVLARAIEQQASKLGDAKLGFKDLIAAAEEVGVDPETVREASRALRTEDEDRRADAKIAAERDVWFRGKRRDLYRHAGVYVLLNAALLAIGLLIATPYLPYLAILALLWGVGLGIHTLVTLTADEDEWREERAGMQWWLEERQRRHEIVMATMAGRGAGRMARKGAPALREGESEDESEGESERQSERQSKRHTFARPRVEAPPEPAQARIRIATDTARERLAEEEAASEETAEVKRGKHGKRAKR